MNRPRHHHLLAAALLLVVVTACGTDGAPTGNTDPESTSTDAAADHVTVDALAGYGCGLGFWGGNEDQTFALLVELATDPAMATEPVSLPAHEWNVTVQVGTDLFSNWCDDFIEPGEPEPDIAAQGEVTTGRLTPLVIPPSTMECTGETASIEVSGLSIELDGVTYDIGDLTLTNGGWGCFAG